MPEGISLRSEWERSSTRWLLHYIVSWQFLRKLLFALAVFCTLMAVFYAYEDWRGKRAWHTYRAQLVSQGADLDIRNIIPAEVPDDQNFAATPFLSALFQGRRPSVTNVDARWPTPFEDARHAAKLFAGGKELNTNDRRLTDLVSWQMAFRKLVTTNYDDLRASLNSHDPSIRAGAADEILRALQVYDPVLTELHAASQRPLSRYKVIYDLQNPWGIFLPHLNVVKRTCELLQLKASAELAKGDTESAFKDLNLILRFIESLQSESFVISHIVRSACVHFAAQILWEGLALERWSEPQLSQLQARLLSYNFIGDLQRSFQFERVAGIALVDLLENDKRQALAIIDSGTTVPLELLARLAPEGWYELERVNYLKLFNECILAGPDPSTRTVSPGISEANERRVNAATGNGVKAILHHMALCRLLLPAIGSIHRKTALGQTAAHEAAVACALERFHKAKGAHPKTLEELVPEFLSAIPNDPISGKPLKYQPDPAPKIYSVGWNQKDDGGIAGKTQTDGDWVWNLRNANE